MELNGSLNIDANLIVKGTASLDNGAITTDGSGNINTTGSFTVGGNPLPGAVGSMTSYALSGTPVGVAFDGINMWTANYGSNTIDKIGPTGVVTTYSGLQPSPEAIAFDGVNMWITSLSVGGSGPGFVTKVAPDGTATIYSGTGTNPVGIAFDGVNMWTANVVGQTLSKVAPDGSMTAYALPTSEPYDLAFDGTNMWVTDYATGNIMVVTPDGGVTVYPSPGVGTPYAIVFDGIDMWVIYTSGGGSSLVKVAPDGTMTVTPNTVQYADYLCYDGTNLWTNSFDGTHRIAVKIGPDDSLTYYEAVGGSLADMAFDGLNIWAVSENDHTITKIVTASPVRKQPANLYDFALASAQLPSSAAGPSGGDLSGTYPNPVVAQSSAATFTVTGALAVDGSTSLDSGTITTNGSGTLTAAGLITSTLQVTTGVTSGDVLTSDASGNATWQPASSSAPGGVTGDIQYNNAGVFAGDTSFTTNGSGGVSVNSLSIGITQVLDSSRNLSVNNLSVGGLFSVSNLTINQNITVDGLVVYQPNSMAPGAVQGGVYYNSSLNALEVSLDGSTFTPILTSSSSIAAANISAGTAGINITGNAATANALNSATTVVNVSSATAPTTGQVLTATSGTAATWQTPGGSSGTPGFTSVLGTGADGAVVISSNTALASTYNFGTQGNVAVKNYSSLTVNNGSTLSLASGVNGMILYCTGTVTVNGTITASGQGATGGVNTVGNNGGEVIGWATPSSALFTQLFANPSALTGSDSYQGFASGNAIISGAGSAGNSGNPGGAHGVGLGGPAPSAAQLAIFNNMPAYAYSWGILLTGAGGGGLGNGETGQGGSGGGFVMIFCNSLIIGATGVISANGGSGPTSGAQGIPGAGGGGAGLIVLAYETISNSGSLQCNGGAGGSVAAGVAPGGAGGTNTTINGTPTSGSNGVTATGADISASGGGGSGGPIVGIVI